MYINYPTDDSKQKITLDRLEIYVTQKFQVSIKTDSKIYPYFPFFPNNRFKLNRFQMKKSFFEIAMSFHKTLSMWPVKVFLNLV